MLGQCLGQPDYAVGAHTMVVNEVAIDGHDRAVDDDIWPELRDKLAQVVAAHARQIQRIARYVQRQFVRGKCVCNGLTACAQSRQQSCANKAASAE